MIQIAIREEMIERITPMYIAQSVLASFKGDSVPDFETYLSELEKPKQAQSKRTSVEIQKDFDALLKKVRDDNGINI